MLIFSTILLVSSAVALAVVFTWFDPKGREERAMRARQQAIIDILAEWQGGRPQPTTIEGEFRVVEGGQ